MGIYEEEEICGRDTQAICDGTQAIYCVYLTSYRHSRYRV